VYTHEPVGDVARIGWVAETDLGADEALGHPNERRRQKTPEQAADAIRDLLAPGPCNARGLDQALNNAGFSERATEGGFTRRSIRRRPPRKRHEVRPPRPLKSATVADIKLRSKLLEPLVLQQRNV
jgi:hypothetical protein